MADTLKDVFKAPPHRAHYLPLMESPPGESGMFGTGIDLAMPGFIYKPLMDIAKVGQAMREGTPVSQQDATNAVLGTLGLARLGPGVPTKPGETTLGMFIGPKNIPKKQIEYAKKLEKQGKTRKEISILTEKKFGGGPLVRMPDGRWRKEISDKGARFQPGVAQTRALEAARDPNTSDKEWLDARYAESLRTGGMSKNSYPFHAHYGESTSDTFSRIKNVYNTLKEGGKTSGLDEPRPSDVYPMSVKEMRNFHIENLMFDKELPFSPEQWVEHPLGDVIKHPGLEHYVPEGFKRVGGVDFQIKPLRGERGHFSDELDPISNRPVRSPKPKANIRLESKYFKEGDLRSNVDMRSTMLHELQHMTQHFGGTERGGSPEMFLPREDYIKKLADRLKQDGFVLDTGERGGRWRGTQYIQGIRKWGTTEGLTTWNNNYIDIADENFDHFKTKTIEALKSDNWGFFLPRQIREVEETTTLDQLNTTLNNIEEEKFGPASDVGLFHTLLSEVGQSVEQGRYLKLSELPPYVAPILNSLNVLDRVASSQAGTPQVGEQQKTQLYMHILGEAEARLTQLRAGMTGKERAERPHWEDWKKIGVNVDEKRVLTHEMNLYLDSLPLSGKMVDDLLEKDPDMTKSTWPTIYKGRSGALDRFEDPVAQESQVPRVKSVHHMQEGPLHYGASGGEVGPTEQKSAGPPTEPIKSKSVVPFPGVKETDEQKYTRAFHQQTQEKKEEIVQKMIDEGKSDLDILNTFYGTNTELIDKVLEHLTNKYLTPEEEPDPFDPA